MNKLIFILPLIFALFIPNTVEAKKKKYPNGDYYEGKMKKDQPNGFGKMYYANGDFYEGEWVNGVIHGQGRLVVKNKKQQDIEDVFEFAKQFVAPKVKILEIYEGTWSYGEIEEGKMIDSANNIYEGTFVDMDFSEGKMTYASGGWASGIWNNKKIYTGDSNGNIGDGIFNGKWVRGKFMDGYCKATIGDDFSYTGRIAEGVPFTGNGKMVLNGDSYDGKWENGKFAGKCKLKFDDSDQLAISSFEGTIDMDGNMDGLAIYNNGDKYQGSIKNSQRNGKGVLEMNKPIVTIDGEWSNDKLLTGKGYIVFSANDYSFTIGNSQENYEVKVKNPYNYQTSFQLTNETSLSNLLSQISTVVKSKLLLTEERLDKYRQAEDARLQSRLETYRNENYRTGEFTNSPWGQPETKYTYTFEDVEYQYYTQKNSRILHGKFHIWNGYRWLSHSYNRGGSKYSVEGTFYKGTKNGKWVFEEFIENRLRRRLTINYKMGKKNGLCTLERFGLKNGSKGIIMAYYKNNSWDKNGTQYYYFNNENETYAYRAIDERMAGAFDAIGEFINTHTYVDRKLSDIAERSLKFDNNGNLHGEIYIREGDIELKEIYQHGKLIKSEKRNNKKGIVLSPRPGENRFAEMWKEILPADANFGKDFLLELANMDLHEEAPYNGPYEP